MPTKGCAGGGSPPLYSGGPVSGPSRGAGPRGGAYGLKKGEKALGFGEPHSGGAGRHHAGGLVHQSGGAGGSGGGGGAGGAGGGGSGFLHVPSGCSVPSASSHFTHLPGLPMNAKSTHVGVLAGQAHRGPSGGSGFHSERPGAFSHSHLPV